MAIKPFAIQGSDLTLGGVNLQAGTTSVVIPGVTQATTYIVKDLKRLNNPDFSDGNIGWPQEFPPVVIDGAYVAAASGDLFPIPEDFIPAQYQVTVEDDGEIEIEIVNPGSGYTGAVAEFAATVPMRINAYGTQLPDFDPNTPDTGSWTIIDWIVESGVGEIENVGGGGSTGNFTFSDDTISNDNDASIEVVGGSLGNIEVNDVDELVPPGGIWRLFISDEEYPTLGTTVQIGDTVTTSWGTPITATITDIQQDSGDWQIHVDQDITAGHDEFDTVTFNTVVTTKTWTFGQDGIITLPNGMSIDASIVFGIVRIGGDKTRIEIDNGGAPPGFTITTSYEGTSVDPKNWLFGPDGDITFPDGTTQTTAYTGTSSGAVGTFFVVANETGEVSKSTDGVTWTAGVDTGASINRVATDGVTVAMIQSDQLSWTTFAGLESSTYVSGASNIDDQIGGQDINWNQIDYAGGYFVAVGSYTPSGGSFTQGVYGYSTDGQSWTFATVDQTVVEYFGNDPVDSDWEFSDVDYNGVGWMFSVNDDEGTGTPQGGGVYITDLTAAVTSARCFSMSITTDAAWNGSAWYMEDNDNSLAGVNTNLDPRNGTFDGPIDPWATDIQDLGIDAGDTVELAGGNGYIAASDSDGHVAWSDDNGQTWQIVTPIPYTGTISAITQASPAVVTGSGETGDTGEKVIISGSSVSGYNGTFYWEPMTSSLYTDQARITPFDTSGLAPFTGTATLTWSHGQYIDAMDYINGYFYIGNDDEQIARTTNFVSWTIVDDQNNDFEYWNDIAGFVNTGGDIGDIVVEVDSEYTKLTLANKDFTLETTRTGDQDADINLFAADDIFIEANGDDIALSAADQVRINTGDFNGDPGEYPSWTFDNVGNLTIPGNIKSEGNINIEINLSDSTLRRWQFGEDGDLTLPVGGDILDSEGNSVLGGGGVNNNIWVQTFETATPATDVPQVAVSVEYDSDGNIIALFSHVNPVTDSTYYSVGKYTTTGTRIWTTRFAGDFNTDGWGLAVDNAGGFVYIAGDINADGGQDNATLTKISGVTGLVEWSKKYDFGFSSFSSVVDVTSDGDPVMVGFASNGDDRYVATTKVDQTDGSVIWSRALDGQNDEEAYGMAVGPSGEVVAVGYMESFGVQDAAATLYTEPASNPNWTTGVSGPVGGVNFSSVTFTDGVPTFANVSDTLGNRTVDGVLGVIGGNAFGGTSPADDMTVKVATLAANDTDNRMLVVKYAANGTIAWQKAVQFDADFDCSGADADIDSEGNIYVCGQYSDDNVGPIGQLMSIVKFNSSGVKQWSRRVVGNCGQWTSSIVVGADDHLYLSGTTFSGTDGADLDIHLVLAKYEFDGTVAWQRLLDYTAGYSFGTNFFGSDFGGSNLAVKQDYVAVSLGFAAEEDLFGGTANAAVAQISATGDIFTVGNWDFKSASFSGVVNSTASDIVVTDAGKTDYDNIANIDTVNVTLEEDSSDFLIGTLYTAPGGDNSLINGAYSVTLENNGTVTLPAGGTITEGYVTSNPTIQLTPASPDVASQKLVIKGGGSFNYTDNGININYYDNTAIVGATLTFYIYSPTYADQTLYWWIYPEGAGIATPESGTVVLDGSGGTISFELDSDDNEFTVRVSPEADNYDPASLGVETGLINPDAPTFDSEHHLHLTTGDLTETSIFLGTDDHNVRTTVNGGIEITTPNTSNNVWQFGTDGSLTIPGDIRSEGNINIDINLSDSTLRRWQFGEDGDLTFPDATVQTTASVQGEQVFTLDTGAIDYAPTAVDFNLLFVTPAVGYSSADPTSVTLPAGAPGQRLVIFNGYNLATLTVNPGLLGRDISASVVAEFIYSGFDGVWIPLYGTNSPT